MIRMNITMPEDVAKKLNKVKNKSRFITEAVKEKLHGDEMKRLKNQLIEDYKASAKEDQELVTEWDITTADGIE